MSQSSFGAKDPNHYTTAFTNKQIRTCLPTDGASPLPASPGAVRLIGIASALFLEECAAVQKEELTAKYPFLKEKLKEQFTMPKPKKQKREPKQNNTLRAVLPVAHEAIEPPTTDTIIMDQDDYD